MNAGLILAGQTIEIDNKEYQVTECEMLLGDFGFFTKLTLVAGSEERSLIIQPNKLVKVVA